MERIILKRKIALRIASGHPWIFNNEVEKIEGNPSPGSVVEVFYHDGKFVGRGYFNQLSQIVVRLLTRNRNTEINEEFFFKKLDIVIILVKRMREYFVHSRSASTSKCYLERWIYLAISMLFNKGT